MNNAFIISWSWYAIPGSEAASHYFVLTIPASETSPVIYLTAPTEAEVGQTFRGEVIDEVEPDVFVSGERLGIKAGASGRQNARGGEF